MAKRRAKPARAATSKPAERPRRLPKPAREIATTTVDAPGSGDQPTLVAIGASAGGLDAFSQLLQALPADPGFIVVFVQHLAPHHESALAHLLSMQTALPVVQATDMVEMRANHVYVIPPNVQAAVTADGAIQLLPRPTDRSQYTPIDFFLRSVAETMGERAIAVILSGTASDGMQGVRDVNSMGGFTFAQSPETAKYDGMPRAAIATGLVDLVLPPHEIANELVRLSRIPLDASSDDAERESRRRVAMRAGQLDTLLGLLRAATGVDFTRYKPATIQRRLQRRMVLRKIESVGQYARFAQDNPDELQALYQDILIHVTRFFREPESFEVLKELVFPKLLDGHVGELPIRMWVCGCSTGEEPYSLAMTLLEYLGDRATGIPIQLFATDVSDIAVERAREGLYPESIAGDVSPERLRRFFTKTDGGYRINKAVRDLCVFARQDVTRDPPFSRMDLILCRNVLIYMGVELQKKVMTVFHYALKPTGFVMLGHAETVGAHADIFGVSDKRHRIFQKKAAALPAPGLGGEYMPVGAAPARKLMGSGRDDGRAIQHEADRVIQDRYAPPGVIVDSDSQIVQFRGQTGRFLEPAPGDPSLNVLKMAREGLLYGLRMALNEARKSSAPVVKQGLRVRANGGSLVVAVEIVPLAGNHKPHFLVLFHERSAEHAPAASEPKRRERAQRTSVAHGGETIAQLQQELQSSREYLQSIIQELEAANEELQSANEEILSSNEELQSTNEELDTAKEELQSTNEELNTVNEELQGRNDELSRVNSDLLNLLASVQIAIVIVASDLRIRRFTPMAERVLNLIPSDIGRPIGHIKPNIDCADLEDLILDVIENVHPREREVRDRQGRFLSLHVRPYKNLENRIDGAVLALFDIDTMRRHSSEARLAHDFATAVVATVHEPVVILDADLRVTMVNEAFERRFGVSAAEAAGRRLYEVGDGRWSAPGVRRLLEELLPAQQRVENFVVEHTDGDATARELLVNARRLEADDGRDAVLLIAVDLGQTSDT